MTSRRAIFRAVLLLWLAASAAAQEAAAWRDPSPHKVHFVTVDRDVRLEVLDWRGSGPPMVLLAGQGLTAHAFDDFALKLVPEYHVYGITRRGFGASSSPASGYTADRLGDDVLAVLDALKLKRPVLVGHSIGGEEMSSLATRHPERVRALVYLDSAYEYAFYDPAAGSYMLDASELQKKLGRLQTEMNPRLLAGLIDELLGRDMPQMEKDLGTMKEGLQAPTIGFPPQGPEDLKSFAAFRAWCIRVRGLNYPEAELRATFAAKPDGSVDFRARTRPEVSEAIMSGWQKYTSIRVPALAIYAIPHDLGPYAKGNPALAAFEAADTALSERQASAFERGVPQAKVVRIARANHMVFLSNEAEVLREMRGFLGGVR